MRTEPDRYYRKNLNLPGMIFLNEEERGIVVKNLSITGLLVEADGKKSGEKELREIFASLRSSTLIDLFIPSMRMAAEAEVVRIDMKKDKLSIALEFKSISYDIEDFIYKRKVYRKNMPGPGRILLNGIYHTFMAVNASVEGLMIQLHGQVDVEKPGTIAAFEFEKLGLTGEAYIVWCEYPHANETLIGLRYAHLEQSGSKAALPKFEDR